jgi:hypothetical protein
MRNKQLLYSLAIAGISLGTAWAIRGQFGHTYGAAWAGSIIAIVIVLLARRADWYAKVFPLALASAAGWGIGGIISYGIVVGYGRSTDFTNAYYGFLMLFVIGSLFGLLGGGLFGLTLADQPSKPVKWHRLLTEITAGSVVFYYLSTEELGWLMTPPRSEAWAACVGMMVAMFWYMLRHQQFGAIRIAIFAGLGAGFGFSFGNFLQVMGSVSGIHFNFWNVMEYSIGFFGGAGMAYGTFTAQWPEARQDVHKHKLIVPLGILLIVVPFWVWEQSFSTKRIGNILTSIEGLSDIHTLTSFSQWGSFLLLIAAAGYWFYYFFKKQKSDLVSISYHDIFRFLVSHLTLYAVFSILITGAYLSFYRIEQYLYLVNIVALSVLISKLHPDFSPKRIDIKRWITNFIFILIVIALFTAVAISSHEELAYSQTRF